MQVRGTRRTVAAVATACALVGTGAARASEDVGRGIDPHQGESLVEVSLCYRWLGKAIAVVTDGRTMDEALVTFS